MKLTSDEIRKRFLDFFSENGHLVIPSASLIPIGDPTLLMVNSGMAPLKPYFTGEKTPPQARLCNIQKCVRTNDIDSVGDRHHLTFFEMMGNWSIGDYFKEDAIHLAWTMIHDVFEFDTFHLFATVYSGDPKFPAVPPDKESERIWLKFLPPERIVHLGADCNLWGPAGETGPCGPCTEIFIDRGEQYGCGGSNCGPHCWCGRFLEIWNGGVFMQYYMHEDHSLTELPLKSVDAGAGLERFCVILQEVDSVYEIDTISPITEVLIPEDKNCDSRSMRIMTDHIRSAVFMIADGVRPANTRMEYVLRRIIRRAILHANLIKTDPSRLIAAAVKVVDIFSRYYLELESNRGEIISILELEASAFSKVLRQGIREFSKVAAKSVNVVSAEAAFKLHDTLGFPVDLTKELALAQGLSVDEAGFKALFEAQRERSRQKTLKR